MVMEELKKDQILIMFPDGRLDAQTAQDFETAVIQHIDSGEPLILLDFSKLDYISSAGLRSILTAARSCKEKGGHIALSCLNDQVREILKVSGFSKIIKTFPDQETAIKFLASEI